jgi:anti-sigma factor RsiW
VKHVAETELALYTSGDVSLWRRAAVRLHLSGCEACRARMQEYRADQQALRSVAEDLPEGLDWDALSAEMTANIRVGLAAGECVAPRQRATPQRSWLPVAVAAGMVVLLAAGLSLNLQRRAQAPGLTAVEDRSPLVQMNESGIELRANGNSMGVSGAGPGRPVAVSASMQGTARARYVDDDTAQVTITSVYVQ